MQHECRITVLETKVFPEYQEKYLADPKRNRHLVDHSGVCVAYLTESRGGTAYTVDYARKNGVPVINLGEK